MQDKENLHALYQEIVLSDSRLGSKSSEDKPSRHYHEIVVLGLHHAGLRCGHYILRHIIPQLQQLSPDTEFHVSLVAPHTEFFWNPSSPRYLVDNTDKRMPLDKVYLPIPPTFKDYDPSLFDFVKGKATALSESTRIVTIQTALGEKDIKFDSMVIATGTYSSSPLWRMNCDQEETKAAYAEYKTALQTAKNVLIAGGGAVGVESAGEIATRYPHAKVKLLSGSFRLLPRCLERAGKIAQAKLGRLGIDVVHGVKVVESIQNQRRSGSVMGTTNVRLSNLTEEEYDVYLDATGGKPSTGFLPTSWLDESGYVSVDCKTLQVRNTKRVYSIGDCASHSDGTMFAAMRAVAPCCMALGRDIAESYGLEFQQPSLQPNRLPRNTMFVPVGPTGGVGQVLGKRLPSPAIWLIKARDYQVWLAQLAVRAQDCMKP